MQLFYHQAASHEDLPWHAHEQSPAMLAILERCQGGRLLDVGCGAGTESIFFAEHGFAVTGIDFEPKALKMAQSRAAAAGLEINWIEADILSWTPSDAFDALIDRGCMHGLPAGQLPLYKRQLLSWLRPGGDFALLHFDKRFALDWHPLGPRRRRADYIRQLLAPEFEERSSSREALELPFPISNAMATNFDFHRVS